MRRMGGFPQSDRLAGSRLQSHKLAKRGNRPMRLVLDMPSTVGRGDAPYKEHEP